LSLPEVTERLSHGAPTFFIRNKTTFVSALVDGHHDIEFPHLICAAGSGVQHALVSNQPETFFVPAYVGGRGWIGIRLDTTITNDEVAMYCEDAYRTVAPAKLIQQLDERADH
jgi:hypothetical protein